MRWSLAAMLVAIATVAAGLGVCKAFWYPSVPNSWIVLGFYLIATSVFVVAAIPRSRLQGGSLGASLFGVAFLICVLKGGFGVATMSEGEALTANALLGFALLGVSFLASQTCAMLLWRQTEEARQGDVPSQSVESKVQAPMSPK